jgi:hypothetical protein
VFSKGLDTRLKKLARKLDVAAEQDLVRIARELEVLNTRREAAAGLHDLCARFIARLNLLVTALRLELTPPEFVAEGLPETHTHLFQINASGRVVQFSFTATAELEATEDLRVPYTMEGSVCWFNQRMLERDDVREHRLSYCLDKGGNEWRFLDLQTHRVGEVDEDYIAGLLEALL